MKDVPVIDLTSSTAAEEIATACATFGFFQVTHHGISVECMQSFREACLAYFKDNDCGADQRPRRNEGNARGYFDDELTKQRRDWKQCLDVGVPGSRNWNLPDEDPKNLCLDGLNQFPAGRVGFRETVIAYFEACADLSDRIALLMASAIAPGDESSTIVNDLRTHHTSYLRMNYYPPFDEGAQPNGADDTKPLGISPHKDAGFLTVLLQDEDCHSLQVWWDNDWHTVVPVPGALTINTGDMAQVWSNGAYKAPLHRVLTNPEKDRFSAPFFYNPGYASYISPVVPKTESNYHPVLWGYFRAVRFAGDLTNLGVEIQIEDFEKTEEKEVSKHLRKQQFFATQARFDEPFSVERYSDLLLDN